MAYYDRIDHAKKHFIRFFARVSMMGGAVLLNHEFWGFGAVALLIAYGLWMVGEYDA